MSYTDTASASSGSERAEVVKIYRAYIKVKHGKLLTRMPLAASAATASGKALGVPGD